MKAFKKQVSIVMTSLAAASLTTVATPAIAHADGPRYYCTNTDVQYDREFPAGYTFTSGSGYCTALYAFDMQPDGNLVLYNELSNRAVWSTGTFNHGGAYAEFQTDGNLVVYQGSSALWSSHTYGWLNAHFAVQQDGNLVIYSEGGDVLWASNTQYAK
ncbi:hypothetical protein ABH926_005379 [Catenulispora sp. GP43]|uniref:hypothetical protein n=1 Tax=Catenulispora sp. GP43 TaxID=3156263 RepID=UPI0035187C9D